MMPSSFIAVVGSLNEARNDYDPAIKNVSKGKAAAEAIGKELANRGYGLIVYSGRADYIEGDVVRGYISSGRATPDSIQIRYPQRKGVEPFAEQESHPDLFDEHPDAHENWQVSFYRSLQDATGILIIGGGPSALITAIVADTNKIPLVSIAAFGGSAENVWSLSLGSALSERDRKLMAAGWTESSAAKTVALFSSQAERLLDEKRQRRLDREAEKRRVRYLTFGSVVAFASALALTAWGTFAPPSSPLPFGLLFFGTPMLAGAAGGLLYQTYRYFFEQVNVRQPSITAALGLVGGALAAILFVLAQWFSHPNIDALSTGQVPAGLNRLIPFELVIATIAGLTLDSVFSKLRGLDVLQGGAVAVTRPGQTP